MPKAVPFEVGETYAGCEVLHAYGGSNGTAKTMSYTVRYLCCSAHARIPHTTLQARILKKCQVCKKCASKSNATNIAKVRARNQLRAPALVDGVFDLTGYFWPSLNVPAKR